MSEERGLRVVARPLDIKKVHVVRIERLPDGGWLVRTQYDGLMLPPFKTRREARAAARAYRLKQSVPW